MVTIDGGNGWMNRMSGGNSRPILLMKCTLQRIQANGAQAQRFHIVRRVLRDSLHRLNAPMPIN